MAPAFSSKAGFGGKSLLIPIGIGSVLWLTAAPVAGHFLWPEAPSVLVLLLAAMAELMLLTVWLVASTLHDPVRRWDLPPNPADAQRRWRGLPGRLRRAVERAGQSLRARWPRRAANS